MIAGVCAEVADAEPEPFEAVTTTRTDAPTPADVKTYVWPVAPAMSEQPEPSAAQRRH